MDASTPTRPGATVARTPTPEELLERFGLDAFRPGQREAVQAALAGRDSLVVMPTGGGKSLCYQLPALADRGLVVVVSPLIALMTDQWRPPRRCPASGDGRDGHGHTAGGGGDRRASGPAAVGVDPLGL
jgi:ATP-dependent helicase YprA (DUF1998 family)